MTLSMLRLPPQWAVWSGALAVALCVGIAISVASSPASITARSSRYSPIAGSRPGVANPAANAPRVIQPGTLRARPHLVAAGSMLVADSTSGPIRSADGGKTWKPIPLPESYAGILVDARDPNHLVAGGDRITVSTDGGASWRATRTPPPAAGPYAAMAINPGDPGVWLFFHQGKLLRTRDAGLSWKELGILPPLNAPVVIAGAARDQFFVADGSRVFELDDNGSAVQGRGTLPNDVAVLELAQMSGNQPPALLVRASDGKAYAYTGLGWSDAGAKLGGPIAAVSDKAAWVGDGAGKLGVQAAIAVSNDAGNGWAAATGLPADESVEGIVSNQDASAVYAYCFGGDLYVSTDGGKNWKLGSTALRAAAS